MSNFLKLIFIVVSIFFVVGAIAAALNGHVMLTILDLFMAFISGAFVLNIGEEVLDNE